MELTKTPFDWKRWQQRLNDKLHIFEPFREYLQGWCEEQTKDCGYERRPTLGLRLHRDGRTIAIRPGWIPTRAKMDYTTHPPTRQIKELGRLVPSTVTCEVIGPPKLLSVRLEPLTVTPTGVVYPHSHDESFRTLLETIHYFMVDPASVFRDCADSCGICHKTLTDNVSQTRGIGPECIQRCHYFATTKPKYAPQYNVLELD